MAEGVAVVTGGASGIGLATTLRLLHDGWSVQIGDLNAAAGEDALAAAAEAGHAGRVACAACDVTREDDVRALVAAAVDGFGPLGLMVNNAGVPGAYGAIDETDLGDWDFTMAVLLRGAFLGTKHAVRAFAADGGAIVNVASVAGLGGGAGPQAYSAAKAGVISLTQTTAVELAPRRIRVNAVAPGPVMTPILGTGERRRARVAEVLRETQPWPDAGRAEDIAAAIAFLAGADAGFVTGHTLVVDGGQTAAGPVQQMNRVANPRARGLVGVDRGSTGEARTQRRL